MKKKRFQKPAPAAAGPPPDPAEKAGSKTAPASGSSSAQSRPSVSGGQAVPLTRPAPAQSTLTDSGAEPTAARTGFPVLLFALLALLLYWGDVYLMANGGEFSAQVFHPYVSTNELCEFIPKDPAQLLRAKGQKIFKTLCETCHQANGAGSPGQFPPLAGSEWVLPEGPNRIIRLVLNGGLPPFTVNGAVFNGAMPPQRENLTDDDIAAVLTYVRSEWGNKAPPVMPEQVGKIRDLTKDRTASWTMDELKAIPEKD